jgi:ABC-type multidrug transport system ATPase subunit
MRTDAPLQIQALPNALPFPLPPAQQAWLNISLFWTQRSALQLGHCPAAMQCNSTLALGGCAPCALLWDSLTLKAFLHSNPGYARVVFLDIGLYFDSESSTSSPWHVLLFNGSARTFTPLLEGLIAVESALLVDHPAFNISLQPFPQDTPLVSHYDIFLSSGAQFTAFSAAFSFSSLLNALVEEKASGLYGALALAGMLRSSYWLSWFLHVNFQAAVSSLLLALAGVLGGFNFFTKAPTVLICLLYYCVHLSLAGWALLFSSFITSPSLAHTAGFAFALAFYVFILAANVGGGGFMGIFWLEEGASILRTAASCLPCLFPGLPFATLLAKITQKTSSGVFTLGDLLETSRVEFMGGRVALLPCPLALLLLLLLDGLLATSLGLWLQLPQCTGGTTPTAPPIGPGASAAQPLLGPPEGEGEGWEGEGGEGGGGTHQEACVLSVKHLSVTYSAPPRCCRRQQQQQQQQQRDSPGAGAAVQGLSLSIRRGEVVALLGMNGAGKSTVFKALSRQLVASGGEVTSSPFGVCPQTDCFFALLTAKETLELCCHLKGLPLHTHATETHRVLRVTGLREAGFFKTEALSGGMRRRLTLATALLGAPPLLLLDECTTALDAVTRGALQSVIHGLKRASGVLFTTHCLSEASRLADRVVILRRGRVLFSGTPAGLLLQCSGVGGQFTVRMAPGAGGAGLRASVRRVAPSAAFAVEGSRVLRARVSPGHLLPLLHWCQAQQLLHPPRLTEVGVATPTLEDAYMALHKEAEEREAAGEGGPSPPPPRAAGGLEAVGSEGGQSESEGEGEGEGEEGQQELLLQREERELGELPQLQLLQPLLASAPGSAPAFTGTSRSTSSTSTSTSSASSTTNASPCSAPSAPSAAATLRAGLVKRVQVLRTSLPQLACQVTLPLSVYLILYAVQCVTRLWMGGVLEFSVPVAPTVFPINLPPEPLAGGGSGSNYAAAAAVLPAVLQWGGSGGHGERFFGQLCGRGAAGGARGCAFLAPPPPPLSPWTTPTAFNSTSSLWTQRWMRGGRRSWRRLWGPFRGCSPRPPCHPPCPPPRLRAPGACWGTSPPRGAGCTMTPTPPAPFLMQGAPQRGVRGGSPRSCAPPLRSCRRRGGAASCSPPAGRWARPRTCRMPWSERAAPHICCPMGCSAFPA